MSGEIYLVRSAVLAGFNDLVRELGADPEPFYRRVGLTAKLTADPEYMVPCARVCRLLDSVARELGCNDFGLMLGRKRKLYQVGLLWPLFANSPNVEQALKAIVTHLHLHNRGMSWQLEIEGDRALLTRADRVASEIPTFQWAVYSTCAMFGGMKSLCGKRWRPSSVGFIHPPPSDRHKYTRFFGVNVEFNREFSFLSFPASDLDREISGHDSSVLSQLNKQIQALEDEYERQEDFCSKIRLLIQQRIHRTDCTQTAIAGLLSMHPKTLQRKLNDHGVTFRELKVEVRLDMAKRYLKDSEIALTTIADILGFSELSSFSHAFKTRHHVSPAVWRDKARAGNA